MEEEQTTEPTEDRYSTRVGEPPAVSNPQPDDEWVDADDDLDED
jgi:hypothetical protein